MAEDDDPSLTVAEAAERLRLSVPMVYLLCKQKQLVHERHGRRVLVPTSALKAYRQSKLVPAWTTNSNATAPEITTMSSGSRAGALSAEARGREIGRKLRLSAAASRGN